MELLKLIQSKNRCLQKLLTHTKEFILSEGSSDFETRLETLQNRRQIAIKTFILYDQRITLLAQNLPAHEKTPLFIETVQKALLEQNLLTQTILLEDHKIIEKIEEEKSRLLKELATSTKASQVVKKFRSKWLPEPGETLDGKL